MSDSIKSTGIDQEERWFVMRDLTRPNAKTPAWRLLGEAGFEVFTPMHTRVSERGGRKVREEVPVIHDLLFVRSTPELLDPVVGRVATLQYRYARGKGYRVAQTVREPDMERFILAVSNCPSPRYYLPSEVTPAMYGRRVRIVGGPMDGLEGDLLKARGSRRRRLLVGLEGLLTVAVEVAPEFISILPE